MVKWRRSLSLLSLVSLVVVDGMKDGEGILSC